MATSRMFWTIPLFLILIVATACPSDGYETNLDFLGGDLTGPDGGVIKADSVSVTDNVTTVEIFTPDEVKPPPSDSASDSGKTDTQTGPKCGNDKCEAGENQENCPEDCDDPVLSCLEEKCGDELATCLSNAGCVAIIDCTDNCPPDDQGCFFGCIQEGGWDAGGLFWGVLDCGDAAGCFDQGPEPSTCGNGACEPGETPDNCPEDCDNSGTECGNGECEFGENQWNCPDDCGNNEPDCGNGECEPGENQWNCPEDCDNSGTECGNGECEPGENQWNCPEDCDNSGTECGNGECELGETPDNCPADCDSDPQLDCIMEHCAPQFDNCVDDPGCLGLISCLQDCQNDEFCEFMCFQNADENAQVLIQALGDCMDENGCSEPDPGPGPSDGSCQGRCGEYDPQEPCQCDIICLVNSNCCDDYQEVCGTGTNCILEECEIGNCLNYGGCTNALECMGGCSTPQCVEQCVEDASWGAQNYLDDLGVIDCVNNNCLGSSTNNGSVTNPTNESLQCLLANCADAYAECLADTACAASLACTEQCASDDTGCAALCAQQAGFGGPAFSLGICGFQNGCVELGGFGGF